MSNRFIIGLAGSLRAKANSRALLKYAASVSQVPIKIIDISNIPLYNQDVEDVGYPQPVQALREEIRQSAGILFSLCEYNGGISGVLKNTIDWASRNAHTEAPLKGKKAGVISGGGRFGGSRAEANLRFVGETAGYTVMPEIEVIVHVQYYAPPAKINTEAEVIDEATKDSIRKYLSEFNKYI